MSPYYEKMCPTAQMSLVDAIDVFAHLLEMSARIDHPIDQIKELDWQNDEMMRKYY
jgi:hypothetical protein